MRALRALAGALLAAIVFAPACATRQPPPPPPQAPAPPAPVSVPAPPAPVSVPAPPAPLPTPPPRIGAIDCPVKREWSAQLLADPGPLHVELRECATKDPLVPPRQQVAVWREGQPALAWGLENRDDSGNRFLIEQVEPGDLDADGAQELLILMRHEGTGAYLDWCLLGRTGSGLGCWDHPALDASASKLLRADEDFGFHGWQLRALPRELRLTRSVYHKGVDPNCCPTRGSIVARLVAREGRLVASSIWRSAAKARVR